MKIINNDKIIIKKTDQKSFTVCNEYTVVLVGDNFKLSPGDKVLYFGEGQEIDLGGETCLCVNEDELLILI